MRGLKVIITVVAMVAMVAIEWWRRVWVKRVVAWRRCRLELIELIEAWSNSMLMLDMVEWRLSWAAWS